MRSSFGVLSEFLRWKQAGGKIKIFFIFDGDYIVFVRLAVSCLRRCVVGFTLLVLRWLLKNGAKVVRGRGVCKKCCQSCGEK